MLGGKAMAPHTFKDIDETVSVFNSLLTDNLIFRGISDRRQLLPKIIRYDDCSKDEIKILEDFEQYYGAYESINIVDNWEFLALAQHYGLMTRLIDFTTNPYIALFFALHSKKRDDEKYLVYALDRSKTTDLLHIGLGSLTLDDGVLSIYEHDQSHPYAKDTEYYFSNIKGKSGLFVISPNYKNNRVLMQQGLFFVPKELEENSIFYMFDNYADCYEIPDSLRDDLLQLLDKLGYNEFRLMPDIEMLCLEINNIYRNKIN